MKTYILYHGHCYDGFGAAFAAWLRFEDEATYIPVSYGQPIPEMEKSSVVYIVDFSYPKNTLLDLMTTHHKVVVLDHHHTAQNDLKDLIVSPPYGAVVRFDMEKSGAVMACEYFHEDIKCEVNQLGEFFAYLQDRDLWTFSLPKSREVSMALRSYPFDFKVWSDLSGLTTYGQIYEAPGICIDRLKKEGETCRRLTEMQVDMMAKNACMWEFKDMCDSSWSLEPSETTGPMRTAFGYIVPVANATVFFSEVGERLLELYPAAPFSAYYLDRKDGLRQWGMRSRPDFDCSKIAKIFGGGGHKQAAGFTQNLKG